MGDGAEDAERRAEREIEEPPADVQARLEAEAAAAPAAPLLPPDYPGSRPGWARGPTAPGPLADDQIAMLNADLDRARVKKREGRGGGQFSYLEGHDVKRTANSIFGFGNWGYRVVELVELSAVEVESRKKQPGWHVGYRAVVEVTVRGCIPIADVGYGDGVEYGYNEASGPGSSRVTAQELALKESVCVPLTTRILTPDGFVGHEKIGAGSVVAGYDIGRGETVWTTVQRVQRYADEPVIRIRNSRSFDVVCTPQHDWVKRRPDGRVLGKSAFADMDTQDAILCAAPMLDSGSLPATPDEAARVGFAICDGTFERTTKGRFSRFAVYQSKPKTVEWCRQMFGPFAKERLRPTPVGVLPTGSPRDQPHHHPAYVWEVAAEHSQAWLRACGVEEPSDLPWTVARLSPAARRAMLDAILAADGQKEGRTFGKKRKPWIHDVVRALCALEGIYTGVTRTHPTGGLSLIRLQSRPVVTAWNCRAEDAGRADVWCPVTETGTWIAQFENGVTTITGNTDGLKRALVSFGDQFGLILYVKDEGERRRVQQQAHDEAGAAVPSDTPMSVGACMARLAEWVLDPSLWVREAYYRLHNERLTGSEEQMDTSRRYDMIGRLQNACAFLDENAPKGPALTNESMQQAVRIAFAGAFDGLEILGPDPFAPAIAF